MLTMATNLVNSNAANCSKKIEWKNFIVKSFLIKIFLDGLHTLLLFVLIAFTPD